MKRGGGRGESERKRVRVREKESVENEREREWGRGREAHSLSLVPEAVSTQIVKGSTGCLCKCLSLPPSLSLFFS